MALLRRWRLSGDRQRGVEVLLLQRHDMRCEECVVWYSSQWRCVQARQLTMAGISRHVAGVGAGVKVKVRHAGWRDRRLPSSLQTRKARAALSRAYLPVLHPPAVNRPGRQVRLEKSNVARTHSLGQRVRTYLRLRSTSAISRCHLPIWRFAFSPCSTRVNTDVDKDFIITSHALTAPSPSIPSSY